MDKTKMHKRTLQASKLRSWHVIFLVLGGLRCSAIQTPSFVVDHLEDLTRDTEGHSGLARGEEADGNDKHLNSIKYAPSANPETLKSLSPTDGRETQSVPPRNKPFRVNVEHKNPSFIHDSPKTHSRNPSRERNKPGRIPMLESASSNIQKTHQTGFPATLPTSALPRDDCSFSGAVEIGRPTNHKTPPNNNVAFKKFLNLTTQDIYTCLMKSSTSEFHAQSGHISFSKELRLKHGRRVQKCTIKLVVPAGALVDMYVSLNSSLRASGILTVNKYRSEEHKRYRSPVELTIQNKRTRLHWSPFVHMFIAFQSFPLLVCTSPTNGYIVSPGWGITRSNFLSFTGWMKAPAGHKVMVSFLRESSQPLGSTVCTVSRLTVVSGVRSALNGGTQKLVLCSGEPVPAPGVFDAGVLNFSYASQWGHLQFKLSFSFHPASAAPEKTSSGRWNCSVAHWPRFRQHLGLCNVVHDCSGGEDEADCSRAYRGCGRDSFSVGRQCYSLVVKGVHVSWEDAAGECFQRNAYLASLNTPGEWDAVTDIVKRIVKRVVYMGLRSSGGNVPDLYRRSFQWSDRSFAYYFELNNRFGYPQVWSESCSYMMPESKDGFIFLYMFKCNRNKTDTYLCEKDEKKKTLSPSALYVTDTINRRGTDWAGFGNHVTCPAEHVVLTFLACDVKSACFGTGRKLPSEVCDAPVTPLPPHFTCDNGVQDVPYTLVCDHRPDCSDSSDESFCLFPPCSLGSFRCSNQQCVLPTERCDGVVHCMDGKDEEKCFLMSSDTPPTVTSVSPKPPAVITFNGRGLYEVNAANLSEVRANVSKSAACPESHFWCPGRWAYCLPVFVRCNGVPDCPGHEDEADCDSYACPGFYRCRASTVCVHASDVCDGVFHCPQRDDELLCGFQCPVNCTCRGSAFFCPRPFPAENFPDLRFLDGETSGISTADLKSNTLLVLLNVARCGLTYLDHADFPNLRTLDLSGNQLRSIDLEEFSVLKNLQRLSLSGNPLTSLFLTSHDPGLRYRSLKYLDVSGIFWVKFNVTTLSVFPYLAFLNFSGCDIQRVVGDGFHSLKRLKSLDLRNCPVEEFPVDVFKDAGSLAEVWTDNFKLCCQAILPSHFHLAKCHSPSDEISSCDALLRSNFYRIFLSLFSVFALIGNLCSFAYRVFVSRAGHSSSFGILVTHLCVSDFLMGVYLAVIGVADRLYLGTYLWNDTTWKRSAACSVAGYLSQLSSEVSAFIICLITLDRFLVLRFPFSRVHFTKPSAHVACGAAWLVGVVLAGVPLLPATYHWRYYSQTGICIPLPITRKDFAGYTYSFGVTIIVNFALFLLIALGQTFVYWSIRDSSMAAGSSTKTSNNLTIARRLITIALSDFLCWFPVGLLGLLASNGVPIPGEVNVFVAILLLPVNSAINPFLYTLNILLESRRQAREKRIKKLLMSAAAGNKTAECVAEKLQVASYTKEQAMLLIQAWVSEGLLSMSLLENVVNKTT